MKFIVTRLDACGFRVQAGNSRAWEHWYDARRYADGLDFRDCAKVEQIEGPFWDKYNPWRDRIVYVTLEELALCIENIGELVSYPNGLTEINTPERNIREWQRAYTKLDAYILPNDYWSGNDHSIGVRYGPEGPNYISPMAHQKRTNALLYKAQGGK